MDATAKAPVVETTTCEVCDRTGPTDRHPCRFEVACSCWRGTPCSGTGRVGRGRKVAPSPDFIPETRGGAQ